MRRARAFHELRVVERADVDESRDGNPGDGLHGQVRLRKTVHRRRGQEPVALAGRGPEVRLPGLPLRRHRGHPRRRSAKSVLPSTGLGFPRNGWDPPITSDATRSGASAPSA